MKNFLSILFAISILLFHSSCEKKEDAKKTTVTINVKNGSGTNQSGFDVYMYSKTAFNVHGNDSFFAQKTATTDANGNATFDIVSPDDVLWTSTNTTEELYFGVLYSIGGIDKEKHLVITVSEGDTKTGNLVLN